MRLLRETRPKDLIWQRRRDTNVNRGVLQVDGSITSNTFVNHPGTLAGTGTINGNVANNGSVNPGSAGVPGMLTVTGNCRHNTPRS